MKRFITFINEHFGNVSGINFDNLEKTLKSTKTSAEEISIVPIVWQSTVAAIPGTATNYLYNGYNISGVNDKRKNDTNTFGTRRSFSANTKLAIAVRIILDSYTNKNKYMIFIPSTEAYKEFSPKVKEYRKEYKKEYDDVSDYSLEACMYLLKKLESDILEWNKEHAEDNTNFYFSEKGAQDNTNHETVKYEIMSLEDELEDLNDEIERLKAQQETINMLIKETERIKSEIKKKESEFNT